MSKFINALLKEMENESKTTRKMLSIVPDDKYDWKPHPKSMSLRELAGHVAEIPEWVELVLNTSELDFAKNPYEPKLINTNDDIMATFENCYKRGYEALSNATEADMDLTWTLRSGDYIYTTDTKAQSIRGCFCQVVHHRAQLGVYLRMLNIPIPGSYGPSADELEAMQVPHTN